MRTDIAAAGMALALALCTTGKDASAGDRPDFERSNDLPASGVSEAQRVPTATPERPTFEPAWYGWQTLTVDLVTLPIVYAGVAAENGGVILSGFSGYVAGGGIAHAIRGNWGRAAGSVALRFSLPAMGLIKGFGDCDWDRDEHCDLPYAYATFGIAIASVIDAVLLADDRQSEKPAFSGLRMTPSFGAGPRGGSVGLVGTF